MAIKNYKKFMGNKYNNEYFLTLEDRELIKFCKSPPTDCEFMELKEAADILADRYTYALKMLDVNVS